MQTINFPMNGCFDSKTIELAETFEKAKTGDQFKLCLFDSGTVTVDATLAFYEVVRSRPEGVRVHIHSHVCLMGGDVLIWLAGDSRTLRAEAWIHFREYPRNWLERSDFQQFVDSLEGRDMQLNKTPFQENYLTVERLVKKYLPLHLWNRRVWGSELEEWNIIKPAVAVARPATKDSASDKKHLSTQAAKSTDNVRQQTLF